MGVVASRWPALLLTVHAATRCIDGAPVASAAEADPASLPRHNLQAQPDVFNPNVQRDLAGRTTTTLSPPLTPPHTSHRAYFGEDPSFRVSFFMSSKSACSPVSASITYYRAASRQRPRFNRRASTSSMFVKVSPAALPCDLWYIAEERSANQLPTTHRSAHTAAMLVCSQVLARRARKAELRTMHCLPKAG